MTLIEYISSLPLFLQIAAGTFTAIAGWHIFVAALTLLVVAWEYLS